MACSLIVLGLLVVGSLASPPPLRIDPNANWRVIGGSDAPAGLYPYQISLQVNGRHSCGGSIVHREYVVTAAHCVQGSSSGLTVVAGSNKLSQKGDVYKVLQVNAHKGYNSFKITNDIAVLKVEPITFNKNVSKINVQTENVDGNVTVTLSGWGSTRLGGATPDNLQQIVLKTTTVQECDRAHGRKVYETQICTLTKTGEGACHGDSGGPLVEGSGDGRVLVGIVSWGSPCARGLPDVFTRVSSFIDWLSTNCNDCINQ